MRKKIPFFTMVFLLGGFTSVRADVLEELQGNIVVSVGDEVQTIDELSTDKWYVMYQKRGNGGYAWDRSFQVEGSRFYKSDGTGVISDGNTLASDAAQYMVRYVETGTAEDVYYVQFGTGNYFGLTSSETASQQAIYPVTSVYDAAPMHIYNIVVDGEAQAGYFALNLWTTSGTDGWRLDNNNSGSYLSTWETGQGTSISDGNYQWHIYEVTLAETDDYSAALAYATTTYNTYASLVGTFTTSSTGAPGTYDSTAVAAFEAAVEALEAFDSPDGDELTTEQLNALADAVVETYNAAIATFAGYASTVADGYYFIQTYPFFYYTETTEDTEDPETGEVIPGTSTTIYTPKSIHAVLSGSSISAQWDTNDGTAPYLWKVTTVDADNKTYKLENMGTDAQINAIAQSTATTLSTDIDTTVVFDYATTVNDTIYYNIRMSGAAERTSSNNNYVYAHAQGHSSGAGTSGNIIGWTSTASTSSAAGSEWTLVPVSDEEAAAIIEAYAPYKDESARQTSAEAILEDVEPKLEIALDETIEIDTDSPLANESNLTSPHSDAQEGEGDGYEINIVLLDGDATTYWHSDWHSEFEDDHHYIQVECADDAIPEAFVFTFTRRTNNNNQITEWAIYGTNDADAATDCSTCILLGTESTPYDSDNMTMTSGVFENTGNFKYLRFQCTATSRAANTKFFHLSEFQVYPATVTENETSQAVAMGEIYTNLVEAVAAAEAEGDNITAETYTTLKEAAEAFNAVYVDPDTLRTAIDDATALTGGIVIGTNPGEWSSESVTATLTSLIAEATAYDAAGSYTPAQSAKYVADIEAAQDAILAAANPVKEGKWYNFRFATEEMYDNAGWDKSGATSTSSPDLFGKVVAVSDQETLDDSYEIVQADIDLVAIGQQMHVIDDEELDYGVKDEAAEFRFIAVGDTAYIIQNRATGLFLRAGGTSGAVSLDIQPTLWTNSAMGYGKNITRGVDILGNDNATLHTQLANNVLVTWENTDVSSNTGFLIEYVEDVADNYDGTDFNMSVVPGGYYAYTYPVSVTGVTASLYGVQVDETGTSITLEVLEDNTAAAGQPFIYIADIDDPDLYDASAEEEVNAFTHGYELNVTAGTSGRLIGTYESTTAPAGSVIPDGNTLAITKASSTTIAANSAWINAQIEDVESTLNVTVSEDTYTAITTAVENAVEGGDIYTIDGVKVGTGNLSSVKSLKKGLYIVNGTKVLVK